jgi:hypothetical protein
MKFRNETACSVKQTQADPSPRIVTVTHPFHPLKGQQVTILRIRNGADPNLIVRLPDGTHTALTMSNTDFVLPEPPQDALASHVLLDPQGLYQLSLLVQRLLARQQTVPPTLQPSASSADTVMR